MGGLCCCRKSLTAALLGLTSSLYPRMTFYNGESRERSFTRSGAESAFATALFSST